MRFFNRQGAVGKNAYKEFELNLIQLKSGFHEFEFELTEEFFRSFPQSPIEEGKGKAFLNLNKSETMMELSFRLELSIDLECDVSLKPFTEKIKTEKTLIIKFGEEYNEMSEDVYVIPRGTVSYNAAQIIYELSAVAVPMKRIHPDLRDADRPEMAYVSEEDQSADEEGQIDPRWEMLRKLKKE